jgi:hypothetical protein
MNLILRTPPIISRMESLFLPRSDFVTLPQRRGELEKLYVQLGEKFDDICAHVVATLGYGTEVKSLPEDVVEKIAGEADELIENWESDVEMSDDPDQWEKASRPDPGIQQLLAEHHELSERILNIQDEALGRELGGDA